MTETVTVLLTNDDGIEASGILALEQELRNRANVVLWTVAPRNGCSTTSHGMSLARPVFVEERGDRRFAVDGLPADCVYLALFGLLDRQPDVVVSGINRGANLGCDVIYSGTVACAREAAVRGIHGVAASLVNGDEYGPAAKSVCDIALKTARLSSPRPIVLNLNYPGAEFEGPYFARLGIRKYPHSVVRRAAPMGNAPYYWLGGPDVEDGNKPGTDGWLIGRNRASATLLRLDQTDDKAMAEADNLLPFIHSYAEET